MIKHAPEPWSVGDGVDCHRIYDATGSVVANIRFAEVSRPGLQHQAHAHLISAAPELQEQVELFERSLVYEIKKSELNGDDEGARLKTLTLNLVRDVLAKSRGQS